MDDDVLHNSLRSLEKQQRSSMRRSVTSMSPIRGALAIDWKRDGLFFSFENDSQIVNPIAQKVKVIQEKYPPKRMSNNIVPSLMSLPVELIYRILDRLDPLDILISVRNVCSHLERITETSDHYQVKFPTSHGEDIQRDTFGICTEQTSHAQNDVSF
jgi:hypothetical protein